MYEVKRYDRYNDKYDLCDVVELQSQFVAGTFVAEALGACRRARHEITCLYRKNLPDHFRG